MSLFYSKPSDKVIDMKNPNISLAEKWRRHVAFKQRTGIQTQGLFLHKWGPLFCFYTLVIGSLWTFVDIIPTVYVGEWEGYAPLAHFTLFILDVELLINWCGIRWVGSEYIPSAHGTKPADFPVLEDEREKTSEGSIHRGVAESQGVSGTNGGAASTSTKRVPRSGSETKGESKAAVDMEYAPPDRATTKSYDGYSYRMMVATSLPTAEGEIERKPYPYWSWVPCLMCQRLRPPRCHHCVLCKQCVLKRDHHCYFTGKCIGVNNTRFFYVFLFWAFLLTSFGSYHMVPYVLHHMIDDYNLTMYDFIIPIPMIRGVLGHISLMASPLILAMWCILFCNLISFTMSIGQIRLFLKGKTSFEHDNSIKILDTRSVSGKLRSVFGPHWWVNFLVPTYPRIKPVEDAVLWPYIKPC